MRPASLSFPFAAFTPALLRESSKTATALLSASATNRRVPSGESASASGVLRSRRAQKGEREKAQQ